MNLKRPGILKHYKMDDLMNATLQPQIADMIVIAITPA